MASAGPAVTTVLLCRKRPEAREWSVQSENPPAWTGRHGSPFLGRIWNNEHPLGTQGAKELAGALALPHSLAQGQRQLLREVNPAISGLLHCTLSFKLLHIGATALGQTSTSPSEVKIPSHRPSPPQRMSKCPHHARSLSLENSPSLPGIKRRCTVLPSRQVKADGTGRVKAGIWGTRRKLAPSSRKASQTSPDRGWGGAISPLWG